MGWSTWEVIKFLGLTLSTFGGLVIAFYSMFWLLDRGFSLTTGSGKITKKFLCQHDHGNPIMAGFAGMPRDPVQFTTYKLRVLIVVGESNISVNKQFYDCVSVNDPVHVGYSVGRFSQRIYLRKVWNQSRS